jgi:uncharacterized membrane protein YfcA
MEPLHLVVVYAIVFIGALCQSSLSMGYALITVPILLIVDPAFVPVSILLSSLGLSLFVVKRDRTSVDVSGVTMAILGRFVGTGIALLLIVFLAKETFPLMIGGLILFGVTLSLLKPAWKPTSPNQFGAGVLSGMMGTLAGMGGLSMALLYQHQKGAVIRGTLAGFLVIGTSVSFVSLLLVGKCTWEELRLFLLIVPAIALGFVLSRYTIHVLDKGYVRTAILLVSAVSGVVVIVRSLLQGM